MHGCIVGIVWVSIIAKAVVPHRRVYGGMAAPPIAPPTTPPAASPIAPPAPAPAAPPSTPPATLLVVPPAAPPAYPDSRDDVQSIAVTNYRIKRPRLSAFEYFHTSRKSILSLYNHGPAWIQIYFREFARYNNSIPREFFLLAEGCMIELLGLYEAPTLLKNN
ncbi:hypothetical protein ACHAQE_008574 [Botrytis cinerea]